MPGRRVAVVGIVLSLLLVACGGDDDGDDAGSPSDTTVRGATFSRPLKIVLLAEKMGESTVAVPNFFDGVSMAVDALNARGGVGGSPVQLEQIRTPVDPAQAQSAFLAGLDREPSAIIGFPASAQVTPLAQRIATSGVPTLLLATTGDAFASIPFPNDAFSLRPRNANQASVVTSFAIRRFNAKRIGLICVSNAFGTLGCDAAQKAAEDAGVQVVNRVTNGPTATDLTAAVLAMRGADVVVDYNFPNPLGVAANQLVQNGINVPHVDGASAGIAVRSGAVRGAAATNLYGVDDCAPSADTRPEVARFRTDFAARFGYEADYQATESYDAVMMLARAAEEAGSADPERITEQLRELTYEGFCESYEADSEQVMHHHSVITTFAADGTPAVVERFEIPDPDAAGGATTTTSG